MKALKYFLPSLLMPCLLVAAPLTHKIGNLPNKIAVNPKKAEIITGADQTDLYIDYLKGKNIGMVINQTSVIGKNLTLSVDSLLKLGVAVKKIFGPEHGFRGNVSNGAEVNDATDSKTGLPVVSLYGNKHYKPTPADLQGLDLIIFDIQDVGARFYTYLSTLHYVMEACAENNVELMILDRPNPNGFYVDGPVLDSAYKSFVGMQPVPTVYGMRIAEYAFLIAREIWLTDKDNEKYDYYRRAENSADTLFHFQVIKCTGYTHKSKYILPIK